MAAVLSQASSRNPGADLWVLADLNSSRHTLPLDWNLNFQITKAHRHQKAKLPSEIQQILTETELKNSTPSLAPGASLLLPTQDLLPNRWVLIVPYHNLEAWVSEVHKTWKGLGEPSLRIFLPIGQNAGSFQKLWQTYSSYDDFTIILE